MLALGLILAMPAAYAASGRDVMVLALNCPDRNTDPKCPNHVSQAQQQDQMRAKLQAQQAEQLRAKQLSDQQHARLLGEQQEQQRAKLQAQQADQLRARRLSSQQDDQRAKLQAQQADQLRARRLSSQQDDQHAKLLGQQQEQQHAKLQAQQAEQLRATQLSDQQHARLLGQQADQLRARQHPSSDGHQTTSVPPVSVSAVTNVVPHGDHKSFDIRHKNSDGSQMVISQRLLPDGSKRVTGFRETDNARDGTSTRIYSDGRRVTQGRDFERRSVGKMDFVTKRDGLREAVLSDGRPVFRDRYAAYRDRDGSERRMIERTRYVHWSHGHIESHDRPMVRRYDVGDIYGAPVALYRPSRYAPDYYRGFHSRFLAPVVVATAAAAAWAAFATPVTSYDDPVALMGDMQISSGFEEAYADSSYSGATPLYDQPDAVALRSQMLAVQQQVNTSVQGNAALKDQLAGVDVQAASAQVQQAVSSAVPVQISEDVRQQVRQQVRLSVAMHQNGRSLVLSDVLASGYAKIFLFQTAQPVNVDAVSGGDCFLNTGDLIGFSTLPAAGSPVAEMNVIASGSNSCRLGERVQVRLTELQEMLNGFSERVEDNMQRVSACAASRRC